MLLYNEQDLEPLLETTVNDLWDFVNRCNSLNSTVLEQLQETEHPEKHNLCMAVFNYGIVLGNLSSDILWAAHDLAHDKTMNLSCRELISAIDQRSQTTRSLMNEECDELQKDALHSHLKKLAWLRIKVIESLFDYEKTA